MINFKIPFLILSTAMIFTACDVKKESESLSTADIQDTFSCTASVKYGEYESDTMIKRYGKGMWENEFLSPDTLAGVKLVFDNDEITASYKGLEFSVPKSAMPYQAMLVCMTEAVDSVYDSDEIVCFEKDGMLCYEGKLEQGDYTINFDAETGFIKSFDMPNMELTVEFTDCKAENGEMTQQSAETTVSVTSSSESSTTTTANAS